MDKVKENLLIFWDETKYEICICVYLFVRMIMMVPTNIIPWCGTYYGINYSYGLISRGLIGSIFNIVSNGDISFINAHSFVLLSQCLLVILASIFIGKFIRTVEDKKKRKQVIFFVAMYLIMPFSIMYLFDEQNFGRLDLYLYIVLLVQLLLIFEKTTLMRLLIVGFLSVICVAIHEAYALFIFPILLAMLIYKLYKSNFDKKILFGIIFIIFITFIVTVFFNFFSVPNITYSEDFFNDLNSKTDLCISKNLIKYQYYEHNLESHMIEFSKEEIFKNLFGVLVVLILLAPINLFLFKITKRFFETKNKNAYKYTFIIIQMAILIYILPCIVASDWGRWFASLYTFQTIFVCLLIVENENLIFEIFDKIEKIIKEWNVSFYSYLIFLSAFGPFQHMLIFSKLTFWIFKIVFNG